MPASPVSKTTWPMPAVACSQRSTSKPTSCSRPTRREGQAARRRDVETGLGTALVQDPGHHEGLRQAFEDLCAEGLADKIALDQLRGGLADDHRIRCRESLESCRNIRRLAQGQLFLPPTPTHGAHHDQTSVDAEPYRQSDAFVLLEASI